MTSLLGAKIKEMRKRFYISQYDLSTGICTQAYISKIEKGDVYPSADTLMKIADKLGISISLLLDISNIPRHEYIIDVITQIREAVYDRNYDLVKEIITSEKNNKFVNDAKFRQFLTWHEAICFFYKDGNFNQAIKTLDNAIRLTSSKGKVYGEREVEILISKGNLYTDNNNYEMALKTYKSALSHLKNIPRLENIYIPVRLYYNLSRCLRFSKDYSNSLINCDLALKIGKKINYFI